MFDYINLYCLKYFNRADCSDVYLQHQHLRNSLADLSEIKISLIYTANFKQARNTHEQQKQTNESMHQ